MVIGENGIGTENQRTPSAIKPTTKSVPAIILASRGTWTKEGSGECVITSDSPVSSLTRVESKLGSAKFKSNPNWISPTHKPINTTVKISILHRWKVI